jgi:hypothetical protein
MCVSFEVVQSDTFFHADVKKPQTVESTVGSVFHLVWAPKEEISSFYWWQEFWDIISAEYQKGDTAKPPGYRE